MQVHARGLGLACKGGLPEGCAPPAFTTCPSVQAGRAGCPPAAQRASGHGKQGEGGKGGRGVLTPSPRPPGRPATLRKARPPTTGRHLPSAVPRPLEALHACGRALLAQLAMRSFGDPGALAFIVVTPVEAAAGPAHAAPPSSQPVARSLGVPGPLAVVWVTPTGAAAGAAAASAPAAAAAAAGGGAVVSASNLDIRVRPWPGRLRSLHAGITCMRA